MIFYPNIFSFFLLFALENNISNRLISGKVQDPDQHVDFKVHQSSLAAHLIEGAVFIINCTCFAGALGEMTFQFTIASLSAEQSWFVSAHHTGLGTGCSAGSVIAV